MRSSPFYLLPHTGPDARMEGAQMEATGGRRARLSFVDGRGQGALQRLAGPSSRRLPCVFL
ncbi:MAG TPA: hypothetical protein VGS41_06765, partial [Chthonomonadales bacterium]|nr:hypothetical protein [Chthonomonadales bacterium]